MTLPRYAVVAAIILLVGAACVVSDPSSPVIVRVETPRHGELTKVDGGYEALPGRKAIGTFAIPAISAASKTASADSMFSGS